MKNKLKEESRNKGIIYTGIAIIVLRCNKRNRIICLLDLLKDRATRFTG